MAPLHVGGPGCVRYSVFSPADEPIAAPYQVHALTVGANYYLAQLARTHVTLGTQVTVYRPDADLHYYYGRTPVSGQVYLRLNPSVLRMSKR